MQFVNLKKKYCSPLPLTFIRQEILWNSSESMEITEDSCVDFLGASTQLPVRYRVPIRMTCKKLPTQIPVPKHKPAEPKFSYQ